MTGRCSIWARLRDGNDHLQVRNEDVIKGGKLCEIKVDFRISTSCENLRARKSTDPLESECPRSHIKELSDQSFVSAFKFLTNPHHRAVPKHRTKDELDQ